MIAGRLVRIRIPSDPVVIIRLVQRVGGSSASDPTVLLRMACLDDAPDLTADEVQAWLRSHPDEASAAFFATVEAARPVLGEEGTAVVEVRLAQFLADVQRNSSGGGAQA